MFNPCPSTIAINGVTFAPVEITRAGFVEDWKVFVLKDVYRGRVTFLRAAAAFFFYPSSGTFSLTGDDLQAIGSFITTRNEILKQQQDTLPQAEKNRNSVLEAMAREFRTHGNRVSGYSTESISKQTLLHYASTLESLMTKPATPPEPPLSEFSYGVGGYAMLYRIVIRAINQEAADIRAITIGQQLAVKLWPVSA